MGFPILSLIMSNLALLVGSVRNRLSPIKLSLEEANWSVHAFLSAKDALESLKHETYEVIFCDEELKGASVSGLMIWMQRIKPELAFYVIGDPADTDKFKRSGMPTGILTFPLIPSHIPVPSGTPSPEERFANTKVPLSGNTSMLAVSDLIDMMGMTGQNGTIEFDFGKQGSILVNNGMVEHAISFTGLQPAQGLQALAQLIALKDSAFRVEAYQPVKRPSIRLPASTAMTEAARLADEERRYEEIVEDIRKTCPAVIAVAVGYPLSATANQGFGDANDLFKRSKQLLELSKTAMETKVTNIFVTTDKLVYGVVSFNEGNIIAACAPVSARDLLGRAVMTTINKELV